MRRLKLDLSLFLPIIIIFLGILFVVIALRRILQTSDYFRIVDVMVGENNGIDLSHFKGKNIFDIDLQKESQYITKQNPIYRKVRLVRILPNCIFVDFIKRKATAIIKLYRDFPVDEEGIVFEADEELDYSNLPLILGLETKIFGPKKGKPYNIKELTLSLDIIKQMKGNRVLKDYRLKMIDVANLSNASLLLLPENQALTKVGLEIKLGEDNIKEKFNILASLLTQDKDNLSNIKYIDLRFKEPVIKFKDVE